MPGPGHRGSPHVAVVRWSLPSHPWSHHSSSRNQGGGVDRLVADHCDSPGDLTSEVPRCLAAAICCSRKPHSSGLAIRGFFHPALLASRTFLRHYSVCPVISARLCARGRRDSSFKVKPVDADRWIEYARMLSRFFLILLVCRVCDL